jgi:hypothetical protein
MSTRVQFGRLFLRHLGSTGLKLNNSVQAPKKPTGGAKVERRSGVDRRQVNKPPPGGRERRTSMEPRKPEVNELEITPSDWARLTVPVPPGKKPV